MHPVVVLLRYIPYNLILSWIIMGRWGPAVGTLLLPLPNVNPMPANLRIFPPTFKNETLVLSQCPEFYAEDTLIFLQAIYLSLFLVKYLIWKFHKMVFEAVLVVNHQLHVDLGGDSPSLGDSFLLSGNFCHTFGPVHFTKYPPNPAYLEFDLETILIADSLARNRETEYIGHKGKWYKVTPLLLKDKYSYLPAYFVPMTPPLTLQPNCPMKPSPTAKTTSTQMFGVLYITLMGLVDSMVPNSGPWFLLWQYVLYIINLAPILWWALPTGPAVPCPKSPNASTYAWLPDTAKPLNLLNYLAHTIDKRFFLSYLYQVTSFGSLISVPTWEESLINLDYVLALFCPHLKQLQDNQSGCASSKSTKSNLAEVNVLLKHYLGGSQSEVNP
ncbi:hypothetical protein DSO57_1034614 [Entomophthora muscae]|uniref:Uncharacterized protein n=1 Tax=Entomophthora muscae TaxID=34485 RepID=A0ACC2TYF6_9FUNG|nr:hypothetical protein DSO57_1034614 [Entomophthora muscae]